MIRVLRVVLVLLGISAVTSVRAATFVVTNVLDSGPGSLREAILNVNASPDPVDQIHFAIGSGPQTIALTQILPDVTGPVIIDGRTQPGYTNAPLIVINGAAAPVGQHGLKITGGNSEIHAIAINGFRAQFLVGGGHGLVLEGGVSNFVVNCYIGTNLAGTAAVANAGDGIRINNSSSNQIGGSVGLGTTFANLISGNDNGVNILGASNGNTIAGNFIGVDVTGMAAIPNSGAGVAVFAGNSNCIGCAVVFEGLTGRNVISGNGGDGVFVGAPQTVVYGNLIGWNDGATAAVGNDGDGVDVTGAVGGIIDNNLVAGSEFNGILVFSGATGVTVRNNVVGSRGIAGAGNTLNGIIVSGANGNTLLNNRVGGNGTNGIRLRSMASGNTVVGNLVGFGATEANPLANADDGIEINDAATNNTVGGPNPVEANVIGNNAAHGILITDSTTTGNTIRGNFIGARSDLGPAPNTMHGVAITSGASGNSIGGTTTGFGNRIFFNGGAGVFVESGTGNAVRGNRMDLNAGLGIDLAPLGVTPNDAQDPDSGPNLLQNFPVLNSAIGANGQTTITGTLQSFANNDFHIDFFATGSCDGSGNGEGGVYLGSTLVATNGTGDASINAVLPVISPGRAITATATDGAGNTSEFSACVFTPLPTVVTIDPSSGSAAGGYQRFIGGTNFQTGAGVRFDGTASPTAMVLGPTEVLATVPALLPGTLNDVTVRNPDGQAGTLVDGFLADFTDVPQAHIFHNFVETIFRAGVTAGCGSGNYCVDAPVRRDQMAVFLLIARSGSGYVPPPATGMVFLDVPVNAFAAAFIEALAAAQVTAGCGSGNFCPVDAATREQMAVFLLRTLEGPSYNPPACTTPTFSDVPCSSPFAAWIEELVDRGVTAGCGGGLYCPFDAASRGEMAVFLVATFGL